MVPLNQPRFCVKCVGHDGSLGHTEYIFNARHVVGCEWTVQRRYQDLHDLHDRLSSVFGNDLPDFPPRTPANSVVGVFFGGGGAGRQPEVVAARVKAFQRYFDILCEREDVVRTRVFQASLGIITPEPVSHLRVRGWLPATDGSTTGALVDIRPPEASVTGAVVDAYRVLASLVFNDTSSSVLTEELCPVADFKVPAAGATEQVEILGLKRGALVQVETSAINAVGESASVAIRIVIPDRELHATPAQDSRSSFCNGDVHSGAPSGPRQDADLPAERPTLEAGGCRDDRLEIEDSQVLLTPLSSCLSRRLEEFDTDLQRREQELEERARELQEDAGAREMEIARAAEEQRAEWDALDREKDALRRQEEEFRRASYLASESAEESFSSPLAGKPAFLDAERLHEHHLEFEALPNELLENAEAREAELSRAAEQQRVEWEALEREKDLLRRQRTEREEAMAKSFEEQQAERDAIESEKSELQSQREALQRIADLTERQQASLEADSAEVSDMKQRMTEVSSLQAELDERKAQLRAEQEQMEIIRQEQVNDIKDAEEELMQRAEDLTNTERQLVADRQQLNQSRHSLAVVQAHVVSLLDQVSPTNSCGGSERRSAAQHRLDDEFGGEDGSREVVMSGLECPDDQSDTAGVERVDSIDGVWGMDWAASFPARERDSNESIAANPTSDQG